MPAHCGPVGRPVSSQILALIAEEQRVREIAAMESARRLDQIRQLVDQMSHQSTADSAGVTLLADHEVNAWITEQIPRITSHTMAVVPSPQTTPTAITNTIPRNDALLSRGVTMRTLYQSSVTHDPAMRRHVRRYTGLGIEYRTLPTLPIRMLIADNREAIVPLDAADIHVGAIVVNDRLAVAAFVSLFEMLWRKAIPFGAARRATGHGPSTEEQALLRLLDAGLQDDAAAQELGLSTRTVRRMVSSLSERLGAQSRFQLGVLAHQAGWLDDDTGQTE